MFQDLNLVSHLTAAENAALPLLCRGVNRRAAITTAIDALDLLGLAGLAGRRPGQLSGGQRPRVAIARAFAGGARAVLADEPTGSLDPENAERVMAAFGQLCRRYRRPCVVLTHNVELAARHADRVLRIDRGGVTDVTADVRPVV